MDKRFDEKYQGVSKSSLGYRLLTKQGWAEGKGLGLEGQGISEHVKIKTKFDSKGIGMNLQALQAKEWSLQMVSYDSVLRSLQPSTAQNQTPSNNHAPSPSSSTSTTYSTPPTPNNETAKTTKPTPAKRKKAPKTGEPECLPKAAKVAPKPPLPAEEKAGKVMVPRPRGRYKRREQSKLVGAYSASDLAAILGGLQGKDKEQVDGVLPPPPTSTPGGGDVAREGDAGGGESGSQVEAASKKVKKKQGKKRQRDGEEGGQGVHVSQSCPSLVERGGGGQPGEGSGGVGGLGCVGNDDGGCDNMAADKGGRYDSKAGSLGDKKDDDKVEGVDLWWKGIFVRGKALKAEDKNSKVFQSKQKDGFLESEQENLYNQVKGNAAQGKGGLGKSSQPRKVAGVRWQGTKKYLGSDSEDDDDEEQGGSKDKLIVDTTSQSDDEQRVVVIMPSLKKQSQKQQMQQTQNDETGQQQGRKGNADSNTTPDENQQNQTGQKQKKGSTRKAGNGAKGNSSSDDNLQEKERQRHAFLQVKWQKVVKQVMAEGSKQKVKVSKAAKLVAAKSGVEFCKVTHPQLLIDSISSSKKYKVDGNHIVVKSS